MDETGKEQLGRAQDLIERAAQYITAAATRVSGGDWGTDRVEYLAQSLSLLNDSWSMVRATMNELPFAELHQSKARRRSAVRELRRALARDSAGRADVTTRRIKPPPASASAAAARRK